MIESYAKTGQTLSVMLRRLGLAAQGRNPQGLTQLVRWIVLGSLSGILAGLSSYVFLRVLDSMTSTRQDNDWLVYLLPPAGVLLGWAYHSFGGRAAQGKSLIIEQIHDPTEWVPMRMAPMILVGTWITHLFGGSAGREGTALQLSGSLTDGVARYLPISAEERRVLLQASIAGGFGGVFGVPLAGTIFALEVPTVGRIRTEAFVPALCASMVGNAVVHVLGYNHGPRPAVVAIISALVVAKVALASIAFGLTGAAFALLSQTIRTQLSQRVRWAPLRQGLGGLSVLGLSLLFGHDYLGLSLPLLNQALTGTHLALWVFALKLLFTAITFGSGLPGGEVTPLFVMGATLGSALAPVLGLEVTLLASVGFVAVFAGAAKTPLACTVMGLEFFGTEIAIPLVVACALSFAFSGRHGIYRTQRWASDHHSETQAQRTTG
jgi:H+/Cl- antiporter ClcA